MYEVIIHINKLCDSQSQRCTMEILTQTEIDKILKNSSSNPVFQYYGVRLMVTSATDWKEVVAVSNKGLVMIKGNSETGYEHIRERHNFWSIKPYPKGKEFQAQSKFPKDITPIDFLKIADAIYSPENFVEKNDHVDADNFEKYVGEYSFNGEALEPVNLILYKNTKFVHSLYPQKNKYNKNRNRKKYPYARGEVKVNTDRFGRIVDIFVPFLDVNLHQKYGLLIDQNRNDKLEEWNILYFNGDGKYEYHITMGTKPITEFKGDTYARITFQHCDLKVVEDFLLEIDKRNSEK